MKKGYLSGRCRTRHQATLYLKFGLFEFSVCFFKLNAVESGSEPYRKLYCIFFYVTCAKFVFD